MVERVRKSERKWERESKVLWLSPLASFSGGGPHIKWHNSNDCAEECLSTVPRWVWALLSDLTLSVGLTACPSIHHSISYHFWVDLMIVIVLYSFEQLHICFIGWLDFSFGSLSLKEFGSKINIFSIFCRWLRHVAVLHKSKSELWLCQIAVGSDAFGVSEIWLL